MKTTAILALLLFASCASRNDGFIADEVRQCNPGDPLELQAGFTEAVNATMGTTELTVEVQNNSDRDVTVKSVRVDPEVRQESLLEIQGSSRTFGREIPEGESATFEVPMTIRFRSGAMVDPRYRQGTSYQFEAAVVVQLESGEAYRCRFRLPVPF